MPPQTATDFPVTIIALIIFNISILIIMLVLLMRINKKLKQLSLRVGRSTRKESRSSTSSGPSISSTPQHSIPSAETGPETPFEQFLTEDPTNRYLPKKEQFEAFRKWRAEKGLNWSK